MGLGDAICNGCQTLVRAEETFCHDGLCCDCVQERLVEFQAALKAADFSRAVQKQVADELVDENERLKKALAKYQCSTCGGLDLSAVDVDSLCNCTLPTVTSATLPVWTDGCTVVNTVEVKEIGPDAST